jgi:hypothetical protein
VDENADLGTTPGRLVLWRAIQPELTHCHAIQTVNFDVHEERGTTDSYSDSIDFSSTDKWPWQRVVMTIFGGRLGKAKTAGPIEVDFTGVVYFRFIEAEFDTDYVVNTSAAGDVDVWYDRSGIDESAGFSSSPMQESLVVDGRTRFGAFWTPSHLPLTSQQSTLRRRTSPLCRSVTRWTLVCLTTQVWNVLGTDGSGYLRAIAIASNWLTGGVDRAWPSRTGPLSYRREVGYRLEKTPKRCQSTLFLPQFPVIRSLPASADWLMT